MSNLAGARQGKPAAKAAPATLLRKSKAPFVPRFTVGQRPGLDATPWGITVTPPPPPPPPPRRIQLQTLQNRTWVVAENAGGGAVNANRTIPSIWETFEIIDLNGGQLITGDPVALRTFDGVHYVQAAGGGGSSVNAIATAVGPWEVFTILKQTGPGAQIIAGQ